MYGALRWNEEARRPPPVSSRPDALILFHPLLQFSGIREVEEAYRVASDDIARQISPILHLNDDSPPSLIFFGSEDTLLDWAKPYVERSREMGNHIELYIAEGASHGFFNRSPWYENVLVEADKFLVSMGFLPALPVSRSE